MAGCFTWWSQSILFCLSWPYLSKIRHEVDHADNLKSGSASLVCNCLVPMLSHCGKWNFLGKGHFFTRRHSVIYALTPKWALRSRQNVSQTNTLFDTHTHKQNTLHPYKSELWPQYTTPSSPFHSSLNGWWYIDLPLSLYLRTLLHTSWRLRSRPEGLVAVHFF